MELLECAAIFKFEQKYTSQTGFEGTGVKTNYLIEN